MLAPVGLTRFDDIHHQGFTPEGCPTMENCRRQLKLDMADSIGVRKKLGELSDGFMNPSVLRAGC